MIESLLLVFVVLEFFAFQHNLRHSRKSERIAERQLSLSEQSVTMQRQDRDDSDSNRRIKERQIYRDGIEAGKAVAKAEQAVKGKAADDKAKFTPDEKGFAEYAEAAKTWSPVVAGNEIPAVSVNG